jgi:tight adherence protein B
MGALVGLAVGIGVLLIWQRIHGAPRRRPRVGAPLAGWAAHRRALLTDAGVAGVGAGQLLALQLAGAALAGLTVAAVTGSVSVAACFGVFAFLAPVGAVRRLRARRRSERREAWPEIVDNLASAVRAGLALPEALAGLAVRGPEPLRPAFARFAADYRATGRFDECLDRLADDLADPVGDRVCEALRLAREVGGSDLGRLLRTLSAFLRDDTRTRAELETRQGWTVNAARLAVTAPWLVLLLLATQATTLAAYDSAAGRLLLVVGALTCLVSYRLMVRIGRLPEPRRMRRQARDAAEIVPGRQAVPR